MDFKTLMETSWHLTLKYIGPLILITLGLLGITIVTFGILGPVAIAGYMHAILLMVREGREPKIGDIFSQMRLFLPLLAFGVVALIASLIGFAILVIPGIVIVAAITFGCLYMMPLMTDRGMGLIDAIKISFDMGMKNVGDHLVVMVLFAGISSIGSSVVLGTLFTQPFATVFLMLVYEEKIRQMSEVSFSNDDQMLKQK